MSPEAKLLIDEFLKEIRLGHCSRCQEILQLLAIHMQQDSSLERWLTYLKGYFVLDCDQDLGQAEQILSTLLPAAANSDLDRRVLYTLGRIYDLNGRWQEALDTLEKSLGIAIQLNQPVEQARAWNYMGLARWAGFNQGNLKVSEIEQAIAYCQNALAILDSTDNPSYDKDDLDYLIGALNNTLGLLHVCLGRYATAIKHFEIDLAICQEYDDQHGIGLTSNNLGEAYLKQGNWEKAQHAFLKALTIVRDFENRYDEIDILINLGYLHYRGMGQNDLTHYETAFDYYHQAIEGIENFRIRTLHKGDQTTFFSTTIDTFANMILLCLDTGREAQAFHYVERSRSRAFLDILDARPQESGGPVGHQIETEIITLAEAQAALPPATLLLEYFTAGLVEAREGRAAGQAERHRFPPARTLLFAITSDAIQVYEVGLSPNDLYPHHLDDVVAQHFLEPHIRRDLYDRLIGPIEKVLWDKRRVYLVPHGPLHYIPFQALIAPDGETLLRETGPQLVYAPSATLLFRSKPQHTHPPEASCLTIGYNSEGESQLYFAENEAHSIARLTQGQSLAGPMPKKATLFSQAANYRLLHLACHGEFDPESPLASFLHLAPGETLTGLEVMEQLRLQCDLATLSACESGLSRVRRGDELMGLMRAFIYAGAPTLVSTLWRVNDPSTRILMEKFYQEIQAGVDFAEALKRAQLYVKNLSDQEALAILASLTEGKTSGLHTFLPADPYFWAPFILVGDREARRGEEE